MFGLTPLGVFHTALSLAAVTAGLIALLRDGRITSATRAGRIYIITTAITCLTGFGIFQHGGFNKAHVLGIITLVVLGIAWTAGHSTLFGRASRYVETIGYSATMLFNLIPGITETATRLPLGARWFRTRMRRRCRARCRLFLIGAQRPRHRRAARALPDRCGVAGARSARGAAGRLTPWKYCFPTFRRRTSGPDASTRCFRNCRRPTWRGSSDSARAIAIRAGRGSSPRASPVRACS